MIAGSLLRHDQIAGGWRDLSASSTVRGGHKSRLGKCLVPGWKVVGRKGTLGLGREAAACHDQLETDLPSAIEHRCLW